jgi:hypothetical protein
MKKYYLAVIGLVWTFITIFFGEKLYRLTNWNTNPYQIQTATHISLSIGIAFFLIGLLFIYFIRTEDQAWKSYRIFFLVFILLALVAYLGVVLLTRLIVTGSFN